MSDLLGVSIPKRENHDWYTAQWGNCVCGEWARLSDGVCAKCHDAEYEARKEAAYQMRIQQLQQENNRLRDTIATISALSDLEVRTWKREPK